MLEEILTQLALAEEQGWREIEDGDVWRLPLPDSVFNQIVPDALEDQVIEAMVQSNKWMRLDGGFAHWPPA